MLLCLVLLLSLSRGLTAQDSIAAVRGEDRGTEGQRVSLRCNYETTSNLPNLHWYKQVSDVEAPQFLLWKGAKKSSVDEHNPNDHYGSVTTDTSTELQIETATLADSGLYYCALERTGALTFGKPIRLTVFPKDDSPVSPTLFLLGRLQPAGSSQDVGSQSGPDVCLAAGFRPNGDDMVLETTVGPVPVKTNPARLSATTKTYYYPGFSNGTISSCRLGPTTSSGGQTTSSGGQTTSSGEKAGDQADRIYPEKSKQNFFVLLVSAVRLIFAKAVASSAILTIRTLIM